MDRTSRGLAAGLDEARLLADALDRRRLTTLFQPLVDLATGGVIGHEALSRGPAGSLLEPPGRLFAAARAVGRTAELDWACRCAAFRSALHSTRRPSWRLFVNAEPEALDTACPSDLLPDWLRAHRSLRVVVELTERHLLSRPAELLRVVGTLRELGWEVALDDVGANDDGVAMLPVVEPDVVKLDAALLGERLSRGQRATLRAVEVFTARTGTPVVAEGIETEAQLHRAIDLGATWGQGFRFGRPAPSVPATPGGETWRGPDRASLAQEHPGATPYDVVGGDPAPTGPQQLAELLGQACSLAAAGPVSVLLLVSTGDGSVAPPGLLEALDRLRDRCALVALLGAERQARGGLRTTHLPPHDALAGEVSAVVLGPHTALVVAGRPRPDGRFDVVRSDRPHVVARAARLLLARAAPQQVAAAQTASP